MKKSGIFIGFAAITLLFALLSGSCEKEKLKCGDTSISQTNGTQSHNNGQNCMNCHKDGGNAEGGCFTIAGSLYDSTETNPNPNATVRLFTGINGTGTLKATLHVDGKGNFYTTEAVDFTGGLFTEVQGATGNFMHMGSSISMGQCNSCHGVTTNKLFVN